MRINQLAKELGERFNITVKSSALAEEIREMDEFTHLRDSIKTHASSVDDHVVDRVIEIYSERHGGSGKTAAEVEEERRRAEEEEAHKAELEAKRREEILQKRKQLEEQKAREAEAERLSQEKARQRREAEMKRRQDAQGRGPAGPVPVVPARPAPVGIPLPRIAPIPLPGVPRPGAAGPAAKDQGQAAPPAPAAEETPKPAPAPEAKESATVQPVPQTQPRAVAPTPHKPAPSQAAPPQGRMQPREGRPMPRPVAPRPSPSVPHSPRPMPLPGQQGRMLSDGQPAPPPPPPLRNLRPPAPAGRPGGAYGRQGQGGPGAPSRPGGPQRPGAPSDRPRGRREGPSERPPRGGERGPRREETSGELVIPEIGVMTLKGGQARKGRPAAAKDAKGAPAKKKGLKTIVREEIEFKPSKVYGLADEFRRPISGKKTRPSTQRSTGGQIAKAPAKPAGPVRIGSMTTVAQFAEKLGISAAEIIKKILMMGQRATINQLVDPDLAELIAQDMGVEVQVELEGDEQDIEEFRPTPNEANMVPRPPVVTIMGHVDHGKTTLLDAYRSSSVVDSEFGGITQHIGAYKVETPRGTVVFLDTPGHAAFTSMRARGAQITDIVVLVVSADDGVMPQTIEAINHAREAGVPMIVAINKIDLPGANPERVRMGLMQYSIVPEALGGETIFVEISAKNRTNLDQLLEMILLQAEVLELKADPTCAAEGTIIESHVDRLRGAVATVLIEHGTLHVGDTFVVGDQWGRVRVMIDDRGKQVREAGPANPVEIIGLSGSPDVGELFVTLQEERVARQIAELRADRRRQKDLISTAAPRHMTLEDFHERVAEGKTKELKVVLKADVQGSLEAVSQSIQKLGNEEVGVRILHQATGSINESDVALASASDAIIVGFNVRPDPLAAAEAEREGLDIKTYRIIYELIEDFQKAIVGMLEKRFKEVEVGRVEIRQLFKVSRLGMIAGCMVLEGEVTRNATVRLVRDGVVVYQGKIASLRRMKDDAARVAAGYECGLTLENFQDIKEGDILEVFKLEEIPAELAATT